MKESDKYLVGSILALALVMGVFTVSLGAKADLGGREGDYRRLLGNVDESLRSLRLGGDPSGPLGTAQRRYDALVAKEDIEGRSDLEKLDNEIRDILQGGEVGEQDIRSVRGKISMMAGELEFNLAFAFENSALVILVLSASLAFLATFLCRKFVDWGELEEAKKGMEEWRRKIREARRKKGKKKRKLEVQEDEMRRGEKKTWRASIKQAVIYLTLFIPFLAWFGLVYGDWTVAWIPFDWFSSLQPIGVSFSFFGWFLLSYFGSAQIWRELLISEG